MKRLYISIFTITLLFMASTVIAGPKVAYEGYKKCGGCHKSQKDSWLETTHAKAMHSLKPGEHKDEKKKAKLDPDPYFYAIVIPHCIQKTFGIRHVFINGFSAVFEGAIAAAA